MIRPWLPKRSLDTTSRLLGLFSTLVIWALMCIFFGYIFYQGFSAIFHYGFDSLFLSSEFNLNAGKVSFWAPYGVTLFLTLATVILTIPIALRCAIWFHYYCPSKLKKPANIFLLILANVPSVILAIYARRYLAPVFNAILGLENSLNLVVATFSLVCMTMPLIILLFLASLENKKAWIIGGELLGLEKNYAIHKIIVPKIKHTVLISVTLVAGKVLSESIMLSMLLSSENYKQGYGSGFFGFIGSQLNSVAPLIGENYFSDGSSEKVQNLMFLYGGLLLITSIICNSLCLEWMKRNKERVNNTSRRSKFRKLRGYISWNIYKSLSGICAEWERGVYTTEQFIYLSRVKSFRQICNFIRRIFEYICLGIFLLYASSFLVSVVIGGIQALFITPDNAIVSRNDTLSRSILNTLLIVFWAVLIAVPISLFSAFYLSEYAVRGRFKKYTLALINAVSSTPSIIFGIFGLFIFIQKLGWTASGSNGKSLLAGILTMILFITPYLVNLFHTHISEVSDSYRESSYILGIPKYTTFWKIIFPIAFNNLMFSMLMTIGKIMGETAPIYLTAGINSAPGTLFMYQGQTLTTRIYAQLYESNLEKSEKIINETSFFCLLFISVAVIMGKFVPKLFSMEFWRFLFLRLRHVPN